jgi:putative alpha-1,2-mannosidase
MEGSVLAREVMEKMYFPTPDGYCGDEDNGQTSAWYVFSAMGFYPVTPGADQYVLGAPLFPKMTIELEDGNVIEINAPENSKENIYIDKMYLNGEVWDKNYVRYSDLMKGAVLDFEMTDKPNLERGTDPSAWPYSYSKDEQEMTGRQRRNSRR